MTNATISFDYRSLVHKPEDASFKYWFYVDIATNELLKTPQSSPEMLLIYWLDFICNKFDEETIRRSTFCEDLGELPVKALIEIDIFRQLFLIHHHNWHTPEYDISPVTSASLEGEQS